MDKVTELIEEWRTEKLRMCKMYQIQGAKKKENFEKHFGNQIPLHEGRRTTSNLSSVFPG